MAPVAVGGVRADEVRSLAEERGELELCSLGCLELGDLHGGRGYADSIVESEDAQAGAVRLELNL